ncbi:hypothetical protein HDU90_004913 [Geranomyces variabilis]|nr:hypothetical protein HDU90_004913 [Geranomyces variabilis]
MTARSCYLDEFPDVEHMLDVPFKLELFRKHNRIPLLPRTQNTYPSPSSRLATPPTSPPGEVQADDAAEALDSVSIVFSDSLSDVGLCELEDGELEDGQLEDNAEEEALLVLNEEEEEVEGGVARPPPNHPTLGGKSFATKSLPGSALLSLEDLDDILSDVDEVEDEDGDDEQLMTDAIPSHPTRGGKGLAAKSLPSAEMLTQHGYDYLIDTSSDARGLQEDSSAETSEAASVAALDEDAQYDEGDALETSVAMDVDNGECEPADEAVPELHTTSSVETVESDEHSQSPHAENLSALPAVESEDVPHGGSPSVLPMCDRGQEASMPLASGNEASIPVVSESNLDERVAEHFVREADVALDLDTANVTHEVLAAPTLSHGQNMGEPADHFTAEMDIVPALEDGGDGMDSAPALARSGHEQQEQMHTLGHPKPVPGVQTHTEPASEEDIGISPAVEQNGREIRTPRVVVVDSATSEPTEHPVSQTAAPVVSTEDAASHAGEQDIDGEYQGSLAQFTLPNASRARPMVLSESEEEEEVEDIIAELHVQQTTDCREMISSRQPQGLISPSARKHLSLSAPSTCSSAKKRACSDDDKVREVLEKGKASPAQSSCSSKPAADPSSGAPSQGPAKNPSHISDRNSKPSRPGQRPSASKSSQPHIATSHMAPSVNVDKPSIATPSKANSPLLASRPQRHADSGIMPTAQRAALKRSHASSSPPTTPGKASHSTPSRSQSPPAKRIATADRVTYTPSLATSAISSSIRNLPRITHSGQPPAKPHDSTTKSQGGCIDVSEQVQPANAQAMSARPHKEPNPAVGQRRQPPPSGSRTPLKGGTQPSADAAVLPPWQCRYYGRGRCLLGDRCGFVHDESLPRRSTVANSSKPAIPNNGNAPSYRLSQRGSPASADSSTPMRPVAETMPSRPGKQPQYLKPASGKKTNDLVRAGASTPTLSVNKTMPPCGSYRQPQHTNQISANMTNDVVDTLRPTLPVNATPTQSYRQPQHLTPATAHKCNNLVGTSTRTPPVNGTPARSYRQPQHLNLPSAKKTNEMAGASTPTLPVAEPTPAVRSYRQSQYLIPASANKTTEYSVSKATLSTVKCTQLNQSDRQSPTVIDRVAPVQTAPAAADLVGAATSWPNPMRAHNDLAAERSPASGCDNTIQPAMRPNQAGPVPPMARAAEPICPPAGPDSNNGALPPSASALNHLAQPIAVLAHMIAALMPKQQAVSQCPPAAPAALAAPAVPPPERPVAAVDDFKPKKGALSSIPAHEHVLYLQLRKKAKTRPDLLSQGDKLALDTIGALVQREQHLYRLVRKVLGDFRKIQLPQIHVFKWYADGKWEGPPDQIPYTFPPDEFIDVKRRPPELREPLPFLYCFPYAQGHCGKEPCQHHHVSGQDLKLLMDGPSAPYRPRPGMTGARGRLHPKNPKKNGPAGSGGGGFHMAAGAYD